MLLNLNNYSFHLYFCTNWEFSHFQSVSVGKTCSENHPYFHLILFSLFMYQDFGIWIVFKSHKNKNYNCLKHELARSFLKWIYFLVDLLFYYIISLEVCTHWFAFCNDFYFRLLFYKCKLLYRNKSWFKP